MLEEDDFKKKLILASASPRRKKILKLLKLDFEVVEPGGFKEEQFKDPQRTVLYNSIAKAKNVYGYLTGHKFKKKGSNYKSGFLIAGFDTIIYINRRILGKPDGREQAIEFLKALSGRVHLAISGACIMDSASGRYVYDSETTRVSFRKLTEDEIERYVDKEDVTDKAGAYNILGIGGLLVDKIDGCFFNIAGIPVAGFVGLLKKSGLNVIV
ncbi:MAG: nucleoside triphosphate pyrophosphatase [Actinomycetota bacterium]|nr:nucleoside triphosphate pyrophosphatase [Actinomycetota bacterium]